LVTLVDIIKAFVRGIGRSKISVIGASMTTVIFFVLVISVVLDLQGIVKNPYFGFITYMVLGPMFIAGLILVFIGLFFFKGKDEVGIFTYEYLKEQFTVPNKFTRVRKLIILATFLTVINIIIVSLISYTGYHYTESVAFCGRFCHSVMTPEYTAYQHSPHSRVRCVECHIGPGAQWFVKSKISGIRQLFAVTFNTYSKPIETPVQSLRPARETCEECHRPELFHGDKLIVKDKFQTDEKNTHVQTVLLMKVGSGGYLGRTAQGIHWHVSPNNKIIYTHTDRERKDIPEVRLIKADGTEVVFSTGEEVPAEQAGKPDEGGTREMDCIDCHNRPTHIYRTPDEALNQELLTNEIPQSLPYIKRQALEAITQKYETKQAALDGIASTLWAWYNENYPKLAKEKKDLIEKAIAGAQKAYSDNVFPSMNIGWNTYPNFLGHRDDSGCFRCHDDSHSAKDGETIPMDCDTCHIILAEEEANPKILETLRSGEF